MPSTGLLLTHATKDVTAILEAIGKLPPYARTALIGVILIACGARLAAGLQIWP
jgi:hypothetical protein